MFIQVCSFDKKYMLYLLCVVRVVKFMLGCTSTYFIKIKNNQLIFFMAFIYTCVHIHAYI